jgi:FkbM family methyltransferase
MSIVQSLTVRQRLTWLAHLFKASTQQHHREMIPLLRPLLQPDSVVFDVGAHSGQFARLLAGLVPKGHVYAFEPASYALSLLRYSCAFRRSKNISIYPLGFGDEDAELVLNVPLKRSGSVGFGLSFIGQTDQESRRIVSETIQIKRIDDFVRSHRIDRLSLIKADIEGSEFRMLLGPKRPCEPFARYCSWKCPNVTCRDGVTASPS